MLSIERLRLHLPDGYRDRASLIARQVAAELAELRWDRSITLDSLVVPRLTILPGWSDQQIAKSVAAAVQSQLNLIQR